MATGRADKGSRMWLQRVIVDKPDLLNKAVREAVGLPATSNIQWVSPVPPAYREYRDLAALRKLGIPVDARRLQQFWPARGPVWDALGMADGGTKLLVEAKAHIAELASSPTASGGASRKLIRRSLDRVRRSLAPGSTADWTTLFYQYTNRLAHLYWLRLDRKIDAHLVLVYFLNAADVGGPSTECEWQAAKSLIHAALGLGSHRLEPYVHDVFVDVRRLSKLPRI